MSIIDAKQDITINLRTLRNKKESKEFRQIAYANIVRLIPIIEKGDKDFKFNYSVLDEYKEFKTDKVPVLKPKVNWPTCDIDPQLVTKYNTYVATAYNIVTNRLPKLDPQTDNFGIINNATIANLIQVDLVQALQSRN